MKTTLATLALCLASTGAVAVPAPEISAPVQDLQVTSDFFPGVTFSGTAETIYNEMKALNPTSVGNLTSIAEKDASLSKRASSFNCSWGKEVQFKFCEEGRFYLQALGKAWCGVRAGYGTQARVSCSNDCGIYLSNKLNHDFRVSCEDIASDAFMIGVTCKPSDFIITAHGARDFDTHFIGLGGDRC